MSLHLNSSARIWQRFFFLIVFITVMKTNCLSQQAGPLPDSIRAGEIIEPFSVKDSGQSDATNDTVSGNNNRREQEADDSVVFREVPDSVVKLMKSDKAFAYANNPSYWKYDDRMPQDENWVIRFYRWLGRNQWFGRLLYIFFGGILLVVIYLFVMKIFYSSSRQAQELKDNLVAEHDPDFSARIHAAILANDYHGAIRFLYLKTLKMAGDKDLIKLKIQSTNQDYLMQLGQHPLKESFGLLTHVYEKTCYGGFEINRDRFLLIKERFDQLFKTMTA